MVAYKNPAATVDIIIGRENQLLLIKRKEEPFKNMWAIAGGHLNYGIENLEQAAIRELEEETNLVVTENDLKLLGVYSDPKRDPRGHVISHVYVAENFKGTPLAGDDAKEIKFFYLDQLPILAFDHRKIIEDYIRWRKK